MESIFLYLLGFGFSLSLLGGLIGWFVRSSKVNDLIADVEIMQEKYQALKGQYETNINKYESLYHSFLRMEEKKEKAINELDQFRKRVALLEQRLEMQRAINQKKRTNVAEVNYKQLKDENLILKKQLSETVIQPMTDLAGAERKRDMEAIMEEVVIKDQSVK